MTTERKQELEQVLVNMRAVSNNFYAGAQGCGNHAFLEFTGLMNDYIEVCRDSLNAGIDFTAANTHSGVALRLLPFRAAYLSEKLDCIYGPALRQSPELRRTVFKDLPVSGFTPEMLDEVEELVLT